MQIPEIIRYAEVGPPLVVPRQQDAEIIVAHIGREVVSRNPVDPPVVLPVQDGGLQDLDQREGIGAVTQACLGRDDLQLDRRWGCPKGPGR